MLEALIAAFETIEDPRCEGKVEHRLLDILVIAVCAVLGQAESFEDIALYGRCKRDWLGGFLALPNGIPSHDTFRRGLRWSTRTPSSAASGAGCGPCSALRGMRRGRWRSTARPSGARSTAGMVARPCTWSA